MSRPCIRPVPTVGSMLASDLAPLPICALKVENALHRCERPTKAPPRRSASARLARTEDACAECGFPVHGRACYSRDGAVAHLPCWLRAKGLVAS